MINKGRVFSCLGSGMMYELRAGASHRLNMDEKSSHFMTVYPFPRQRTEPSCLPSRKQYRKFLIGNTRAQIVRPIKR